MCQILERSSGERESNNCLEKKKVQPPHFLFFFFFSAEINPLNTPSVDVSIFTQLDPLIRMEVNGRSY